MALALLSTEALPNPVTMQLLDGDGNPQGSPSTLLPLQPGQTKAFFISQLFGLGDSFAGTLELSSSIPFYALSLRSITNATGDFSLTPYPPQSMSAGPIYLVHLTADSSYSTDLLLWNPLDKTVAVRLDFFSPDGQPAFPLGQASLENIQLVPGQMKRLGLDRRSEGAFYGYARLTLKSGSALPSNTAVITRWENGSPASEAGIAGTPSKQEELFLLAERAAQRTAIALLNPEAKDATVELQLIGEGTEIPAPNTSRLTLRAGEKRAFFLYELFADLPSYVNGLVRVTSSAGIASLALLGVTNQRGEFLIASITSEPGGGYRTAVFLLPDAITTLSSGTQIQFFSASGRPFPVLFR